jgi:hypothetical protein
LDRVYKNPSMCKTAQSFRLYQMEQLNNMHLNQRDMYLKV